MRKLSLFLAAVMLFGCLGLTAYAEEPTQARFTSYEQVNAAITIIQATDTQAELGYLNGVTEVLTVDGLQFKDLNGNGALDYDGTAAITGGTVIAAGSSGMAQNFGSSSTHARSR